MIALYLLAMRTRTIIISSLVNLLGLAGSAQHIHIAFATIARIVVRLGNMVVCSGSTPDDPFLLLLLLIQSEDIPYVVHDQ